MANLASEYLNKFYNAISNQISQSTYFSQLLQTAEDKTGIPAPYIITALTTTFLLFIVLTFGAYIILDMIVVFYPAYRSFQALENPNPNITILMYWMKYWIVFGFLRAAEHIGDNILWWMPGYFLLKFLFLVWCFAPVHNNGSVILYDNYIQPTFAQNAETVENVLTSVRSFANRQSIVSL